MNSLIILLQKAARTLDVNLQPTETGIADFGKKIKFKRNVGKSDVYFKPKEG